MDNILKSIEQVIKSAFKPEASLKAFSLPEAYGSLTALKKGQLITGMVSEVNKQVTIKLGNLEVKAGKELLQEVKPGETRVFEVLSVSDKLVELGIHWADQEDKVSKAAIVRLDLEGDILLQQKGNAGKRIDLEKQFQEVKLKIDEILSKMTEQDYMELEKEGFPVDGLTVEGLYTALSRIKSETGSNRADRIKAEGVEAIDIEKRLQQANLPVTKETVNKIKSALTLSEAFTKIDEKAYRYLIGQELKPTIENIYKASFSGNHKELKKEQPLSDSAWRELIPQVTKTLEDAGFELNNKNLSRAKWLVENKLPLTEDNLIYLDTLDGIAAPADKEAVLDEILAGLQNGIAPKDIIPLPYSQGEQYDRLIREINTIQVAAVEKAVEKAAEGNSEINLKKLVYIQKALDNSWPDKTSAETADGVHKVKNTNDTVTTEDPQEPETGAGANLSEDQKRALETIKVHRQLEEIRLKMTREAALRLERKGIHVETERLEKVVEELREQEESYYKKLFIEAEVVPDRDRLDLLKETLDSMDRIRQLPGAVLGATLTDRRTQTVPGLLAAGNKLLTDMVKANEAYEALATVPNREYGDSLSKAFQNIGPLLKELSLEDTALNRRAVRILGYNQMNITKEAIEQVKAYDMEVSTLINNLKPQVAVRLIKEGRNPLDMPIRELNSEIEELLKEQGELTEDKFSKFLQRLEKADQISEEERKAYIGIYRLLHHIEKSDGAAIGSLVKAEREITLQNLLTAIRTQNKGSLDAVINDDFGLMECITHDKDSITDQLEAVFTKQSKALNNIDPEKTGYIHNLLKNMSNELIPERLPLLSADSGIWESIKDTPVEVLFDQLKPANDGEPEQVRYYEERLQELRTVYKNSDQQLRFLEDYKLPNTIVNVMLADQILSSGGDLFKKLYRLKEDYSLKPAGDNNENNKENKENSLKEIEELSDTLSDRNSINATYEKLSQQVNELLEEELQTTVLDQRKLAELKSVRLQMSLMQSLAKREFYHIPVKTATGITNINLTILREKTSAGKVSIRVFSEQLGNVKAELAIKNKSLKGYIYCDNRNGLERLQKHMDFIEEFAREEGISVKQMDFNLQRMGNDSYFHKNVEGDINRETANSEQERLLYHLAKDFVFAVRAAELSKEDDQAASA